MHIYIVGNEVVEEDRFPLLIVKKLQKEFPHHTFEEVDPNENFIPEEGSIIIDTVEGIAAVTWFDTLDAFVQTRSITPHDYDLGFHLLFLRKLHKISEVRILGVPKKGKYEKTLRDVTDAIHHISV
jgi:hypothetical protein